MSGRTLREQLRASYGKQAELLVALTRIRDGEPVGGGRCLCDHTDEQCCAEVEYFCPVCIAAVAITKAHAK